MSKQVIITAKVHEYLINELQAKGFTVDYRPSITYDELAASIHGASGLIVTTRIKVDRAMLDRATQLEWIGRLGSGMELIDTAYAAQKGIRLASSPEGNRDTVGEQAVGMLVMLMHNLLKSNLELRRGVWERDGNRAWELGGRTVGIVGYGHTGSAFAQRLRGFGVKILAFDKYKTGFGDEFVQEATMEDIFREADVVSLHLPLTEETRHLGDLSFFRSFRKPVYLLNTSRGKVVKTADVVKALETGALAGVALDVLENEKLDTYSETEKAELRFLLEHPRAVVTPHIAGYSHEASVKMAKVVLEKLAL